MAVDAMVDTGVEAGQAAIVVGNKGVVGKEEVDEAKPHQEVPLRQEVCLLK